MQYAKIAPVKIIMINYLISGCTSNMKDNKTFCYNNDIFEKHWWPNNFLQMNDPASKNINSFLFMIELKIILNLYLKNVNDIIFQSFHLFLDARLLYNKV